MNDGGPAFPETPQFQDGPGNTLQRTDFQGMTLRDYFAAKAMPDLIREFHKRNPEDGDAKWIPSMVNLCYDVADAMLKVRDDD